MPVVAEDAAAKEVGFDRGLPGRFILWMIFLEGEVMYIWQSYAVALRAVFTPVCILS